MIFPPGNGLLLLNKKSGITSFDALSAVKKAFSTGKVGHTGTLDKFASGLLLVLVGRALKLSPLFEKCVKEYEARIFFGAETDTLDPEGEVVAEGKIPSRGEIEAVLENFRGDILQAPPAYSALHINGRRAYELAREGKAPEMKKRPATVYSLEISSWTPPFAEMRVKVSAGTYIRSLARDIALAAGTRAHLAALKRTRVGAFRVEDAAEEDASAGPDPDRAGLENSLLPPDKALFAALSLPVFFVEEKAAAAFIHGKPLKDILGDAVLHARPEGNLSFAGVFREDTGGELLGTLEYRENKWNYSHVFAGN